MKSFEKYLENNFVNKTIDELKSNGFSFQPEINSYSSNDIVYLFKGKITKNINRTDLDTEKLSNLTKTLEIKQVFLNV